MTITLDSTRRPDYSWMEQAACTDAAPEDFFRETKAELAAAKLHCRSCPVMDECLDYALRTRQEFGVWGGTSQRERQALFRSQSEPVQLRAHRRSITHT